MEIGQQIVDQEQNFCLDVQDWVAKTWGTDQNTDEYKIVAVIGLQSSGKSTLLNGLFGTVFPVMREDCREQTTRGIWIGKSTKAPYLIMDVEGTDGRERGENQGFERKKCIVFTCCFTGDDYQCVGKQYWVVQWSKHGAFENGF